MISDIEDFFKACSVAPYHNEALVRRMTDYVVQRGHSVLQIHKLDKNDHIHVCGLLNYYGIPDGARVLDAGCGVGGVARIMRGIRPDLNFTLLNISAVQLLHCADFETIHANFHNIPAPDGYFDAVMFNYSIGHGLLDLALFEAARVLRPEGLLLIYDIATEDSSELIEAMGYKAHAPASVNAAAHNNGFRLNLQVIPANTDTSSALDLMRKDVFKSLFAGVVPIIYRFVKDSHAG